MEILIALFAFLTATMGFILIYQLVFAKKMQVNGRLAFIKSLAGDPDEEDEFKKPFFDRVIQPIYTGFTEFLSKMTPDSIKNTYTIMIYQSGYSKKISNSNLMAIQIMMSAGFMLMITIVLALAGMFNLLLVLFFGFAGFILPFSQIRTNGRKRQQQIQQKLPDLLDMLYVSVEAGLGFDMALRKASEKIRGELSNEVKWALDDIAKGKERVEALKELGERTGVDDVDSFITAIIQAEQLGSNIANMLRVQSNTMRIKRRQRAEEAAAKLPIKLIFPLVFFLIPAIFIVILAPAVLNAAESLKMLF